MLTEDENRKSSGSLIWAAALVLVAFFVACSYGCWQCTERDKALGEMGYERIGMDIWIKHD